MNLKKLLALLLISAQAFGAGGVQNGQPVNATVTNAAFLFKNGDDTTTFRLNLNSGNAASGPAISDIQRQFNSLASFLGESINQVYNNLPSWSSSNLGTSGDNIFQRVEAADAAFNGTTGHSHNGSNGNGPQISLTTGITGTLQISHGGTGQITAQAAFDALSPLSTLGDLLYFGTQNSRLAGNTTTTRKFFRQTGTGSVSAAPAWDTLLDADLPLTTNHMLFGSAGGVAVDQACSGDLTCLASGAFTIANSAVTNAKMANMANNTVKGNTSGGTAAPSDLALSDVAETGSSIFTIANGSKAIVGSSNLTLKANLTSAHLYVGNGSNVATDTAISGDVTIGNTGVTAIGSNKVANSQLAQMAAHTFKGNNTGSTANPLDLTDTQATAELNAMVGDSGSGGTKGLAPAPASGDTAAGKFLKADGSWQVPSTTPSTTTDTSPLQLHNMGLQATVSAGAVTFALKQADGTSDPSTGSSAVNIGIRSTSATAGGYTSAAITSALSLTLTSATGLGTIASTRNDVWIYLINSDSAGTWKIAASTYKYDDSIIATPAVKESSSITYSHTTGKWSDPYNVGGGNTNAYQNNMVVRLTGTPPTGYSTGTNYYVVNSDSATGVFKLSATWGGAAVTANTTDGTSNVIHVWDGTLVSDGFYGQDGYLPIRILGVYRATIATPGTWVTPDWFGPVQLGTIPSIPTYKTANNSLGFSTIGNDNFGTLATKVSLTNGLWRVLGHISVNQGTGTGGGIRGVSGFFQTDGANSASTPTAIGSTMYGDPSWASINSVFPCINTVAATNARFDCGANEIYVNVSTGQQDIYLVPSPDFSTAGTSAVFTYIQAWLIR